MKQHVPIPHFYDPLPNGGEIDYGFEEIARGFEGENGRLAWVIPDYQRGRVWTEEQASAFVGHMLSGGMSPLAWFNVSYDTGIYEIIDGQQRLWSMYRWYKGEIPAVIPVTGEVVWVDDVKADEVGWRRISFRVCTRARRVTLSRKEVLRLYLRLNAGGTPHTPEEIERVRVLLEKS